MWEEDLAALVPAPSSGSGAEPCVLEMHASSLIWAVSFGSVSSILRRMALHDLVHLSWDYLLNTNKQTLNEHPVSGRPPDL